jgi:large subunit ribosomal protein L2
MTTPSYRTVLTGAEPKKHLTKGTQTSSGRGKQGRMTIRRRGSGHKRKLRDVDFRLEKEDIPFIVRSVEYDPNRSGFIGHVVYKDGEHRYMLLPSDIGVGDERVISARASLKPGNRLQLANAPIGTFVYNIEIKPGNGAKIVRSAGNAAEVSAKEGEYVHIKLPSSEVRRVPATAWASVGAVSNEEHNRVQIGKAGRGRWKNRRPKVTGRSMNAADHPMGGGEAHARGARKRRKNKWGTPVNPLQKTRKARKYSDNMIVSRRKRKRK